ncbi:hypothetical protein Rsub_07117 [Raphidocelis subcapitata]|uniref:Uncharacterized protein n=1 Tax=Raphidocelis subcapitata TaxID=307507 RepID=A0A2V0P8D8_9CHLO|nr:hypothetical protein Rsub_07117 [Raphidocelis subcapitata]|eukprot:GBF94130.1 hypothetical protein Rsub_07117 [Raphidocelis subcapitata]
MRGSARHRGGAAAALAAALLLLAALAEVAAAAEFFCNPPAISADGLSDPGFREEYCPGLEWCKDNYPSGPDNDLAADRICTIQGVDYTLSFGQDPADFRNITYTLTDPSGNPLPSNLASKVLYVAVKKATLTCIYSTTTGAFYKSGYPDISPYLNPSPPAYFQMPLKVGGSDGSDFSHITVCMSDTSPPTSNVEVTADSSYDVTWTWGLVKDGALNSTNGRAADWVITSTADAVVSNTTITGTVTVSGTAQFNKLNLTVTGHPEALCTFVEGANDCSGLSPPGTQAPSSFTSRTCQYECSSIASSVPAVSLDVVATALLGTVSQGSKTTATVPVVDVTDEEAVLKDNAILPASGETLTTDYTESQAYSKKFNGTTTYTCTSPQCNGEPAENIATLTIPGSEQPPLTDDAYVDLSCRDLGIEFHNCAQAAQSKNKQRRRGSLANLVVPADGRKVNYSHAARQAIPAEVLQEIRRRSFLDVELLETARQLLAKKRAELQEGGRLRQLPPEPPERRPPPAAAAGGGGGEHQQQPPQQQQGQQQGQQHARPKREGNEL